MQQVQNIVTEQLTEHSAPQAANQNVGQNDFVPLQP